MSCHIVRREGETRWDFLALARARPGAEYVGSELLAGAVDPGRETPAVMLGVLVRVHAHIAA